MTLSTTASRVSYAGNDSTDTFAFSFKIWAASNLKVYLRDNATLVDTLQVLSSDYTIDIADEDYPDTGNVVFDDPPATGQTVVIVRDMPLTQELDLIGSGAFPAEAVERQLDKLAAEIQTLREQIGRSLVLPIGTTLRDLVLPEFGATDAGKALVVNATGDAIELSSETLGVAFLSVKSFGAVGDGVADDTEAVNDAFDYLRAQIHEQDETAASIFIVFPGGTYRLTGAINATGIRNRNWGIVGPGAKLLLDFDDGVGLDLTYSRFVSIRDLKIDTAGGKLPGIGILVAREAVGHVADDHHFENVHVIGDYDIACLLNYGSEDFLAVNCTFLNDAAHAADRHGVRLDGANLLGITSEFQTIPADTPVSFNTIVFEQSDIRRANGGPCLFMTKTDGFRWRGFMATTSGHVVELNTTAARFNRDAYFDVHMETTGMDQCFLFTGDAIQSLVGFSYIDYNPFASDEIFRADTGVTSVTLVHPEIKIRNIRNGSGVANGIFAPFDAFHFRKPDLKIFNNGAPVLELWDGITVAAWAGTEDHTGDTNEALLKTVLLPAANFLGEYGQIEVDVFFEFDASGNAKTMRGRIAAEGDGLTGDIFLATADATGTAKSLHDRRIIANAGAVDDQVYQNGAATGGFGTTTQLAATGSLDTEQPLEIVFTAQLANAADRIALKRYTITLRLT